MEQLTYISGEAIVDNIVGKTITGLKRWDDIDGRTSLSITVEGRDSPTMELRLPLDMIGSHPIYLHVHDDDPKAPQVLPGQLSMVSDAYDSQTPGEFPDSFVRKDVTPRISTRVSSSFCICGHHADQHSDVYEWCNTPECPCGVLSTDLCVCGHMKMLHDKNGGCLHMDMAVLCDCTCYVYDNKGIE